MTATTLDTARLEDWMRQSVQGFRGPLAIEPIAGGQSNPTYRLLSPGGRYVLQVLQDFGNRYVVYSDGTVEAWGIAKDALGVGERGEGDGFHVSPPRCRGSPRRRRTG